MWSTEDYRSFSKTQSQLISSYSGLGNGFTVARTMNFSRDVLKDPVLCEIFCLKFWQLTQKCLKKKKRTVYVNTTWVKKTHPQAKCNQAFPLATCVLTL